MSKTTLVTLVGLLFIFAVTLPGFNTAAQAQQDVSLASLEVDFWPEYDRPEMLVIYRAELDPSLSLPVDLQFRIPARAGMPHAVAAGQSNDSLFVVTAERQVEGDWAYISLNTAMPIVRLEYYDPGLMIDGENRSFEFDWAGDYAVDELLLQVQQPCDTSNMVISPSLGSGVIGSNGLVYYSNSFGSLSQGQEFQLSINYTKTSDCLTISTLDVTTELPADTPGRVRLTDVLPFILGFLGVMLIVGGVVWYWQSGRQQPLQTARTRRGRRSGSQMNSTDGDELQPQGEGTQIYCHNCGKRASPSDKFCRSCGTRLRAS